MNDRNEGSAANNTDLHKERREDGKQFENGTGGQTTEEPDSHMQGGACAKRKHMHMHFAMQSRPALAYHIFAWSVKFKALALRPQLATHRNLSGSPRQLCEHHQMEMGIQELC